MLLEVLLKLKINAFDFCNKMKEQYRQISNINLRVKAIKQCYKILT